MPHFTNMKENSPSNPSGSKRCGGINASQADINDEQMRKKHKSISPVTVEAEKCEVHPESVVSVSKTEKLTVWSRDLLLSEDGIGKEASNVNGGRSQRKLALDDDDDDDDGDGGDGGGDFVNEVQELCNERMRKLVSRQAREIREFHRNRKDDVSEMESDYKLEVATTCCGKCNLKILEDNFEKKLAEYNLEKDLQLKELEEQHLAAWNEEKQKADRWVSKAKEKCTHNASSSRIMMGNLVMSISPVVEQINQPKDLVAGGSSCADLPTSGERAHGEMQSMKRHGISQMYKNLLQNYAIKNNIGLPLYTSEAMGPHQFKSKVSIDGKSYETAELFPTPNDSEQAAARTACRALSVDEKGLFKNLLQEFTQKSGLMYPSYKTVKSGLNHDPIFVSTVAIGSDSFQGSEAKTRKQAEMNAAEIAYCALTKGKTMDNEAQSVGKTLPL